MNIGTKARVWRGNIPIYSSTCTALDVGFTGGGIIEFRIYVVFVFGLGIGLAGNPIKYV